MFKDINKKIWFKFTILGLILLVLGGLVGWGISYGYYQKSLKVRDAKVLNIDSSGKNPDFLAKDVDFGLYWRVRDTLKEKYVNKNIPDTKLFYGSLAGMVASLGDPYTVFFDPEMNKEFNEELSGKFDGIGAEIGMKKNILTIIAPLAGSPAEKAGLRSGDKVLAIDGKDSSAYSLDGAVSRIRGKKGTTVKLKIYRDGFTEAKDFNIKRDTIKVKSVKVEFLDNNIAHIKVSNFSGDIVNSLQIAVQSVLSKNSKGIILDLRNDPGGYLEAAVAMSSYWIDKDMVVVSEKSDNDKKIGNVYKARGNNVFKNIPTVILVNEGSASASEIVAGALQDYGIGKLIGEKTFGKGSVQEVQQLDDGSAIKITIAKWYTPNDHSINEIGITPDVEVKLTTEDYNNNKDPQLEKAIELLK